MVIIFSCKQKEANPKSTNYSNKVEVVSGVLTIDDVETFNKLIAESAKNLNYIKRILPDDQTFISFNSEFEKLKEVDFEQVANTKDVSSFRNIIHIRKYNNEEEIMPNIVIPFFANICNKDGYFYLNQNLYKFEKEFVYYKEIISKNSISSEISSGNFKNTANKVSISKLMGSKNAKVLDINTDCNTMYDGNKAFVSRTSFYSTYIFNNSQFSMAQFQVQHRKRVFGVWFNADAPTLTMQSFYECSSYNFPYYTVQTGPSTGESCNSCSQITRTFPLDNGSYVKGSTTVSGTGTDNSYRTCTTYTNTWP